MANVSSPQGRVGPVLAVLAAALFDVAYFAGWLWDPTLTPLEQIGPQIGVLIGYLWGRTASPRT